MASSGSSTDRRVETLERADHGRPDDVPVLAFEVCVKITSLTPRAAATIELAQEAGPERLGPGGSDARLQDLTPASPLQRRNMSDESTILAAMRR
jgi:hypothetical protein